jgi:hypothetical protein
MDRQAQNETTFLQEKATMKNWILKNTIIGLMVLLSADGGCTARTAYDGLRYNQELNCQKMQGADRDDCVRRSDMSYDEYQRHLKAKQSGE